MSTTATMSRRPHPFLVRAARDCRHCQGRVALVTLPSGRRMPVDLVPDEDGTVAVRVNAVGALLGRVLNRDRPDLEGTERLHVAHIATCGVQVDRSDDAVPLPAYQRRAADRRQVTDEADEGDDW